MDTEEYLSEEEYQGKLREQDRIRERCERIIKKYYNPQNIALTEKDYKTLAKGVRLGDADAEKALQEKATFDAYNIVTEMFISGKISGDFEDALQNTFMFMNQKPQNGHSIIPILAAYSDSLRSFNNFSKQFLERSFERLGKSTDLYKKCEKVKLSEVDKIYQEEFLTDVLKRSGQRALRKACATLSEREQYILHEIYWEDKTCNQIAREENHSSSAIYQVRQNAFEKLRHQAGGALYLYVKE